MPEKTFEILFPLSATFTGMLSHSYFLNVSYMEGDDVLKEVSWFVKVHPHSRKNNYSNSQNVQIFETWTRGRSPSPCRRHRWTRRRPSTTPNCYRNSQVLNIPISLDFQSNFKIVFQTFVSAACGGGPRTRTRRGRSCQCRNVSDHVK